MNESLDHRKVAETTHYAVNFLALERLWMKPGAMKKVGGVLCVAEKNGRILLQEKVGHVQSGRERKHAAFARKNIQRLVADTATDRSSGYRNFSDESGGAIRGGHYIYSFAGLPAVLSELAMLGLALRLEDVSWRKLCKLSAPNAAMDPRFRKRFKEMADLNFEYGHLL